MYRLIDRSYSNQTNQENRMIIDEQDREYAMSLQEDQEKVLVKSY